ncbi:RING finger protein 212B-like isoform X2 [Pristis pectinata]|uniref:RING finger protein 212B-like isoform X2 n=1 Tax=Pristis pectinata TaxID=685728 RepID=UPI00223D859E|nr:RING finger protein 212B-like isoform X2 [Pristis pectinata]
MTRRRISRAAAGGSSRAAVRRMDWFHCNKCYQKPTDTVGFSISSCQHILCHRCIGRDKCNVCGSACKHLPLSDNMAAHERMYFRKPSDICRRYLEHIAQVTKFQRKQAELLLSFYKHKLSKMEAALEEAQSKIRTQEKESAALKNQVSDMKRMLTLTKVSPNVSQLRRSTTPRPVAITSPSSRVTPKQPPQGTGPPHSGTATASRPELMAQVTGSSVSRSGGLLVSRGSSVTSGRSTPRDVSMSSPSAGSGDSLAYRSLGRTPTLSGGWDLSQALGLRDPGLTPHSAARTPIGAYTNPLQLVGPNGGGRQTPSASGEARRQIQLNTTPRMVIFRQPSVPPSRSAAT